MKLQLSENNLLISWSHRKQLIPVPAWTMGFSYWIQVLNGLCFFIKMIKYKCFYVYSSNKHNDLSSWYRSTRPLFWTIWMGLYLVTSVGFQNNQTAKFYLKTQIYLKLYFIEKEIKEFQGQTEEINKHTQLVNFRSSFISLLL